MNEMNPYAAPMVSDPVRKFDPSGGIWRSGKLLVMQKNAVLPDICVKSNQETNGYRLKRQLSWHHPALFLSVLAAPIIYIILAMVMSKKATIHIGLSDEWRSKRLMRILFAWLLAAASVGCFFGGFALIGNQQTDPIAVALVIGSFVLFFTAAIFGSVGARMIKVHHIDDYYVKFKGVHPDYLARFPEFGTT